MILTFSRRAYRRLGLLLMFRYGFWRWGVWVRGVTDEAIYPSFVRGKKKILAGYDNWIGYDLLATNPETDEFLRKFHARHCPTAVPNDAS